MKTPHYHSAICAILLLCLAAACSSDSTVGDGPHVDATSDARDTPPTPLDADRDTAQPDADADTSDADTSSDAADTEGEPPCECLDPRDVCVRGRCVHADVDCSDDEGACEEGYSCYESTGECICRGESPETTPDACGPICEDTTNCPDGKMCDIDAGVCRQAQACQSSLRCPDGQICAEHDILSYCTPAGDNEPGDSCDSPADCESGVCEDDECKDGICLDDNDCAPDQACTGESSVGIGTADGCTERPAGCPASCPDGSHCLYDSCVESRRCELSGDCEEGNCVYGLRSQVGVCEVDEESGEDRNCKPEEWRRTAIQSGEPGAYCFLPQPCWSDDNCSPPYECVGAETGGSGASFCGRFVTE